MPSVTHADAPLLADLMPWSVAPPRLGRGWPTAPDAASLKARWDALVKAEGPDREALFGVSRARTLHSAVGQLPGQSSGTDRLARASGPCAEPVRVLHGPFDEQWLIPDHRLIDAARPELWRVADERQVFVVEQTPTPDGPPLLVTSVLPVLVPQSKTVPAARPGRVRPLFRRPDGREPNLAPGLWTTWPNAWATPPPHLTSSPGRSWSPAPAPTAVPYPSPPIPASGRTAPSWATACCG